MTKKYKLAVVIGRFQIFHNGHKYLVDQALSVADNVLVLIGSSYVARNIKNPFTFDERCTMLRANFDSNENRRIVAAAVRDNLYDDSAWAAEIVKTIEDIVIHDIDYMIKGEEIVLVGHKKDKSSYYLDMFPQYQYMEVEKECYINATDLRVELYKGNFESLQTACDRMGKKIQVGTLKFVRDWLTKHMNTHYMNLINEYRFIESYKVLWERTPYPVIFQTVDAVVVRSNHVLMIKRRAAPGKGLWALPGGFLNINEKTTDAAIRELKEETRLDIPDKVLYSCIEDQKRFDHPDRSLRGRTITEAFYFKLPNGKLDKVKGADDAEKARWIHVNDLNPSEIYEDHYSIIKYFIGI